MQLSRDARELANEKERANSKPVSFQIEDWPIVPPKASYTFTLLFCRLHQKEGFLLVRLCLGLGDELRSALSE